MHKKTTVSAVAFLCARRNSSALYNNLLTAPCVPEKEASNFLVACYGFPGESVCSECRAYFLFSPGRRKSPEIGKKRVQLPFFVESAQKSHGIFGKLYRGKAIAGALILQFKNAIISVSSLSLCKNP